MRQSNRRGFDTAPYFSSTGRQLKRLWAHGVDDMWIGCVGRLVTHRFCDNVMEGGHDHSRTVVMETPRRGGGGGERGGGGGGGEKQPGNT